MKLQKQVQSLYPRAEAGKEYRIKIDFAFRNRDAALDFDMGREVPVDLKQTVNKVKEADVIIFAGGISRQWKVRKCMSTFPLQGR